MKFLLDENTHKKLAEFLKIQSYSVSRIKETHPGIDDYQVLKLAYQSDSILITLDKDFGELIFKEGQPHKGIILLRLIDPSVENSIKVVKKVLKRKNLENNFTVVSEKHGIVRIRVRNSLILASLRLIE